MAPIYPIQAGKGKEERLYFRNFIADIFMNIPNKILLLLIFIFCVSQNTSQAEVFSVNLTENGMVSTSKPTLTFLWKGDLSKATLIMIPGGDGHLGLSLDRADLGGFYGKTLKPLANPNITSGLFNVVIFDSPTSLAVGYSYPTSRATTDHLLRIENVVQFYKEKFNKPIWLMGHSNGAVSVTEFYKYLQKNHKESLVAGIIYSSGRNGARFNPDTNLPVLFLAHEKDSCEKSTNYDSMAAYKELIKSDEQKVKYVILKSGEAEPLKHPCYSGYHMFFNAHEEAYKAIGSFASEIFK